MKKFLLFSALVLSISSCSGKENQATEVPGTVTSAFTAKFPQAKRAGWSIEKTGVFEVGFRQSGVESSALLDTTGAILETEVAIREKDLPTTVQTTLTKDFAGYKFDDMEKISDAKGIISFELEAEKGKAEYIVVLNATGSVLSKELKKED